MARELPIDTPSKIICVGLNYRDHAAESKLEPPSSPLLFAKWLNSLAAPGDPIRLPRVTSQVDHEAELGVVIGRRATNVSTDEALGIVAGYVCVNDVSARDVQAVDGQWTRAKSFDSFCPVGPRLAPASEIQDPQALRIRCLVNGEVVQDGTTADMIFGVAEIIAFASQSLTLEPGDLIATGTPAGVQLGRSHPRWLRDGDTVTIDIEGIGQLTNPVVGPG
jgi:2-keto-4-pentenoate hydratase/2-oxohepta-3-ene-1,7-dioic acid hydratase in catechol pathway